MGENQDFWIAFHRVPGIGAARIRLLLQAFGDLERAWRAGPEELAQSGLGPVTLRSLLAERDHIDPQAAAAEVRAAGYRVLTWEDEAYPRRLREIATPPPVLYVWGELETRDESAVAVVGTRTPSAYGLAVADEMAFGLGRAGITVISGLARGIDVQAHRAALRAGARSIAVLGAGLDRVAPWGHREVAEAIAARGAVVSDYPLGTPPEPRNFPPRNRLISGLARAVVVVEGGLDSGALLTAEFAATQARLVFAVPGSIHSPKSEGTNRLISAGARPALSVPSVLSELGEDADAASSESPAPSDPSARRVWEALAEGPAHPDELARRLCLPASDVSAALSLLEIRGQARQTGGLLFVRSRPVAPLAE